MEPQIPGSHTPEQGAEHFAAPELTLGAIEQSGEAISAPRSAESAGRLVEQLNDTKAQNAGQPITQAPAKQDNESPAQSVQNSDNSAADDTPHTAHDDDLIEKEWVVKSKKVIAETAHDPHLQKNAVSKLQADYLQKRFGQNVKLSEVE